MGPGDFSEEKLEKDLKLEAKALGIPSGAAEDFAKAVILATKKKLKSKKLIKKKDLERIVAGELKKYNADLAYVYQIRDKII